MVEYNECDDDDGGDDYDNNDYDNDADYDEYDNDDDNDNYDDNVDDIDNDDDDDDDDDSATSRLTPRYAKSHPWIRECFEAFGEDEATWNGEALHPSSSLPPSRDYDDGNDPKKVITETKQCLVC